MEPTYAADDEKVKSPEKRVRRYQPHWQDTYTWLYFDEDVGKMFCRICKENPDVADPASAYVSGGCCNFQIMSLQSHGKSKGHISAEEISRMKAGVADRIQWSSGPASPGTSSPSSSCGPSLQFAHPIHLFTNTTGGSQNYKATTNMINESIRVMSERLMRNTDTLRTTEGPVVFPGMVHSSYPKLSQGTIKRAGSSHQNTEAVESTGELPATSQVNPSSLSQGVRCKVLNAYAVAKLGMSPDDYVWLCDLDIAKGMDIDGTYTKEECLEIQKLISQSESQKLRKAVEKCKYFSVICDSYSRNFKDMLVYYIKTVDGGKQQLHVGSVLKMDASESHCFSELLETTLEGVLSSISWKSKLVGVQHDLDMKWYNGENDRKKQTMTSGNTEVASVRIKTEPGIEAPHISSSIAVPLNTGSVSNVLSHRCLRHRIQCFVTQTIKPLPYDKRVSELLRIVRQWCSDLFPSSDEISDDKFIFENRIWPRDRLTDVLVFTKKYTKILEILSKQGDKDDLRLKDMVALCKTQRFVKYIHFLSDLLGVLDNLIQPQVDCSANIGEVYENISDTIDNIKKLQKRSGQQLVKVEKEPEFQGCFLSSDDVDGFETDRFFILTSILADLAPRLGDLQENKMAAMAKLTSLSQWPVETEDLKDYADEDLLLIAESYRNVLNSSGVDTDKCLMEWSQLKNHIRRRFSRPNTTSWESIIPTCKGKCENILSLITFILTLPGHSAEVEKAFHYLKSLRKVSNMKAEHFRNQLRIYLNLPQLEEFDPEPYVETWSERSEQDSPPRKRSRIVSREDDEAYPVFFQT